MSTEQDFITWLDQSWTIRDNHRGDEWLADKSDDFCAGYNAAIASMPEALEAWSDRQHPSLMIRLAVAAERIADAQQRIAAVAEYDFHGAVEAAVAERADSIRTTAVEDFKQSSARRGFIGQL